MRTVLFYSGVESFNYYTDQLFEELTRRQHEIFILDLRNPEPEDPHSYVHFEQFLKQPVDLAVCYDSFGFKNDAFIDLWNEQGTVLANIMVDHPLRFHPTMSRHPDRYVQFCVDRNRSAIYLFLRENMTFYFPVPIIVRRMNWPKSINGIQREVQWISFIIVWQNICFQTAHFRRNRQHWIQ